MNIAGFFKGIVSAAKTAAGHTGLVIKAHAPEIMIGTGVLGFGATVFEACSATNKAHDILDEKEDRIRAIEDDCEEMGLSHDSMMSAVHDVQKQTRIRLIKTYLPTATTGIASVILVLGGYKVLNGRYIGMTMLYKTLEAGFEHYRGNVIEEFGADVDWRMMNSVKPEEMERALREREDNRSLKAENQGKLVGKKKLKNNYSHLYHNILDNYSSKWRRYWTAQQVLDWARQKENELNDRLMIYGHVFENEYNDAFGFERTSSGQLNGWIKRPGQTAGHIRVGIDDMPEDVLRSILSCTRNEDIRVPLRPNFDGVIYDLIDKDDDERLMTE